MAFRIPLLAALVLGTSFAAQAQAPAAPAVDPQPAKAAPKKAPAKKAPSKAPAKKAAAPQAPKTTIAKGEPGKPALITTGPKELRDKQGNVIPTDPAAYPIDSARPVRK